MNKLRQYNKFSIALLGAVLAVIAQQYASNPIVQDIVLAATALGVYSVPNLPSGPKV
jgi:hypothetical protein